MSVARFLQSAVLEFDHAPSWKTTPPQQSVEVVWFATISIATADCRNPTTVKFDLQNHAKLCGSLKRELCKVLFCWMSNVNRLSKKGKTSSLLSRVGSYHIGILISESHTGRNSH